MSEGRLLRGHELGVAHGEGDFAVPHAQDSLVEGAICCLQGDVGEGEVVLGIVPADPLVAVQLGDEREVRDLLQRLRIKGAHSLASHGWVLWLGGKGNQRLLTCPMLSASSGVAGRLVATKMVSALSFMIELSKR